MSHTIDSDLPFELAARACDGLEVALLWEKRQDRLLVVVADIRTGDAFCLSASNGREALDVFYHPFAYAARRAVVAQAARREQVVAPAEDAAAPP